MTVPEEKIIYSVVRDQQARKKILNNESWIGSALPIQKPFRLSNYNARQVWALLSGLTVVYQIQLI